MDDQPAIPALAPTRDLQATLPDLIEVLLNRGTILHLDMIIAVADIPLIGVSLKAAVAGIETMIEFGMMRQWDQQTRAWVQRSLSRDVPFLDGEELVMRAAGSIEIASLAATWRPGTIYVTNRRIFVFRREPREMLWERPIGDIAVVDTDSDSLGLAGDKIVRVRIGLDDGSSIRLSAAEPHRLTEVLRQQVEAMPGRLLHKVVDSSARPREWKVWYHEPRASGAVWRGGVARMDDGRLMWTSPLDRRPAINVPIGDILDVQFETGRPPVGSYIVAVTYPKGTARFASNDLVNWANALTASLEKRRRGEPTRTATHIGGPHAIDGR